MCPHARILDDYRTADVICADCGLVLDRLYGSGGAVGNWQQAASSFGSGQVWRREPQQQQQQRQQQRRPLPSYPDDEDTDCWLSSDPLTSIDNLLALYDRQTEIRDLLAHFNMDSQSVVEEVTAQYNKIYGCRRERSGFKKTEARHRLALAFSITNVLAREGFPRPPEYVAQVCGLRETGAMLSAANKLALTEEEKARLNREEYELQEPEPYQYVDPLCAHLGIPFATSTRAQQILESEEVKWEVAAHKPTVVAAAALILANGGQRAKDICQALDCTTRTVSNVQERIGRMLAR